MVQPINFPMWLWVQEVWPLWLYSKQVGNPIWQYVSFPVPFLLHIQPSSIIAVSHSSSLYSQREEALTLVTAAISAGIFNDLGSGSNVDACVITSSRTEMLRNFVKPNERVEKERSYGFRRGVTAWKKEEIRKLIVSEEVVEREGEEMDVS